jgi:plasmid stabilization system protein ParE
MENAMPQTRWSAKRERQYGHIKDSLVRRGKSKDLAEEIAARTVNKERAQHGESETANPRTLKDTPAPVRGGRRSHQGAQGRTRDQLYEDARRKGIPGRSRMNKAELERAVGR